MDKKAYQRLMFNHVRTVALHHFYELRPPKYARQLDQGQTSGHIHHTKLEFEHPNKSAGHDYLPTPWRVLEWVHKALPGNKQDFTFIDMGAGKGRVMLTALQHPYKQIIGVEFSPDLVESAKQTLQPHKKSAFHAVVLNEDASTYELPNDPVILFLFNPFGPPVIDKLAENIQKSYTASPRPILVAYINPTFPAFEKVPCLKKMPLTLVQKIRFSLLSPYKLHLFATPQAQKLL